MKSNLLLCLNFGEAKTMPILLIYDRRSGVKPALRKIYETEVYYICGLQEQDKIKELRKKTELPFTKEIKLRRSNFGNKITRIIIC